MPFLVEADFLDTLENLRPNLQIAPTLQDAESQLREVLKEEAKCLASMGDMDELSRQQEEAEVRKDFILSLSLLDNRSFLRLDSVETFVLDYVTRSFCLLSSTTGLSVYIVRFVCFASSRGKEDEVRVLF